MSFVAKPNDNTGMKPGTPIAGGGTGSTVGQTSPPKTPAVSNNTPSVPAGIGPGPKSFTPNAVKLPNNTTVSGDGGIKVTGKPNSSFIAGKTTITGDGAITNVSPKSSPVNIQASGNNTPNVPESTYTAPDGYSPIRSTLNARGISDDRIGWNNENGMVTVDGRDMFRPDVNNNGTTYANSAALNQITQDAYRNSGNELMAIRDAATDTGNGMSVDWDGENVLIGGQSIRPVYVQDGTAYIPKSEYERLIGQWQENNNYKGNQSVLDSYDSEYKNDLQSAMDQLMNRGEFSYNADKDTAWRNYRDQYEREADAQMRAVLNANNSSLHGASGDVVQQALAARRAAMLQMTDKIPELVDAANDRYNTQTQVMRDNLADLRGLANDYYGRLYQANRDQRADITDDRAFNWQDQQQWFQNALAERQQTNADLESLVQQRISTADARVRENEADWANKNSQLQYDTNLYNLDRTKKDDQLSDAYNRGYYITDDLKYFPWLADFYDETTGRFTISPSAPDLKYKYDIAAAEALAAKQAQDGTLAVPTLPQPNPLPADKIKALQTIMDQYGITR